MEYQELADFKLQNSVFSWLLWLLFSDVLPTQGEKDNYIGRRFVNYVALLYKLQKLLSVA